MNLQLFRFCKTTKGFMVIFTGFYRTNLDIHAFYQTMVKLAAQYAAATFSNWRVWFEFAVVFQWPPRFYWPSWDWDVSFSALATYIMSFTLLVAHHAQLLYAYMYDRVHPDGDDIGMLLNRKRTGVEVDKKRRVPKSNREKKVIMMLAKSTSLF
jgi:hypothetical protein